MYRRKKIVDGSLEEVERPLYIKDYLEDAMRSSQNMRGFNSLRALYLFEKSEALEELANEMETKSDKCYDGYRQAACFLRCDADEAEAEYNNRKTNKQVMKKI